MARIGTSTLAADTGGSNQTFRDPALKQTPNAVLFLVTSAVATSTPANHNILGVGFATSTTNRAAMTYFDEHNVGTTVVRRRSVEDGVILIVNNSNTVIVKGDLLGFEADAGSGAGCSVSWSITPGSGYLITAIMFAATNVALGPLAIPGSIGGTVTSPSLGFGLDVVFAFSPGSNFPANTTDRYLSLGVGAANLAQRCYAAGAGHGAAFVVDRGKYYSNRLAAEINNTASDVWTLELTTVGADTFTLTQRDAAGTGREIYYLALEFAGLDTWVGDMVTRAGAGVEPYTAPGFKPGALVLGLTNMAAAGTPYNDNQAGSYGLGVITPTREYSQVVYSEDGSDPTNCKSLVSTSGVVIPDDDGSTQIVGSLEGFTSTGWEIDYSASVAKMAWAFALETDDQEITFSGITSAEALGEPTVTTGGSVITFSGLATAEAFGDFAISLGEGNIQVAGIGTAEAFGEPLIQPGGVNIQLSGIASAEGLGVPTIDTSATVIKISQSSDDAKELPAGTCNISNTFDHISSASTWMGYRFQDIAINQGALISSAYLRLYCHDAADGTAKFTIYGQNSAAPAAFTTANNNISSRSRLATTVSWDQSGIAAGYVQVEITAIVQAIVDLGTWASGSDLAILMSSLTGVDFKPRNYDFGASTAPELVINVAPPQKFIELVRGGSAIAEYTDLATAYAAAISGDTLRIHHKPTPYYANINLSNKAVTWKGIPGANDELPVISGAVPALVNTPSGQWTFYGTFNGHDLYWTTLTPDIDYLNALRMSDARIWTYGALADLQIWDAGEGCFLDTAANRLYVGLDGNADPNGVPLQVSAQDYTFNLNGVDSNTWEDLEIRIGGESIFLLKNSDNNTVRGCKLKYGHYGFFMKDDGAAQCSGNLVEDTQILDDYRPHWTWDNVKTPPSGTATKKMETAGIRQAAAGSGNIFRRNQVSKYFNGIVCNRFTSGSPYLTGTIIEENEVFDIRDDALEFENYVRFIYCRRNRVYDAYVGFSWTPVHDGPIYCHGNVIITDKTSGSAPPNAGRGTKRSPGDNCRQIKLYNNTIIGDDSAIQHNVSDWEKITGFEAYNNILIGKGGSSVRRVVNGTTRSSDPTNFFDYNLYWLEDYSGGNLIRNHDRNDNVNESSLAALKARSPWEDHGLEADPLLDKSSYPWPAIPAEDSPVAGAGGPIPGDWDEASIYNTGGYIGALAPQAAPPPTPEYVYKTDADMVALYLFEGDLQDYTPNNNDLFAGSGGPAFDNADSKEGSSSADFERSSGQYAYITDAFQTGLDLAGAFSFIMWVKLESTGVQHRLLSKYDTTGNQRSYQVSVGVGNDVNVFVSSDGINFTQATTQTGVLTTGQWHHLAVVYSGSTITIYVDGAVSPNGTNNPVSFSGSLFNSSAEFRLAGRQGNSEWLDGKLDEVGVLDRPLSPDEVSSIFTDGLQDNSQTVQFEGVTSAAAFGQLSVQLDAGQVIELEPVLSAETTGSFFVVPEEVVVELTGTDSEEAFGEPTLQADTGQLVEVSGIASEEIFGEQLYVIGENTVLETGGVASEEVFGEPVVVNDTQPVEVSGIASEELLGTPTLQAGEVVIQAQGIASAAAFGSPTVARDTELITAQGVASGEAFGSPTVQVGGNAIEVQGIASGETFGSPTLQTGGNVIAAQGIASGEALGTPTLQAGAVTVEPQGVASGETFGSPTVISSVVGIQAQGVASAEAFGSPTVQAGAPAVQVYGIASAEAVGIPAVVAGAAAVAVSGIESGEAFGELAVEAEAFARPAGIASAETFGTPTIQNVPVTVQVPGIASAETFGTPTIQAGAPAVQVTGIASAEAVGVPAVTAARTVQVEEITSEETFGTPTIQIGVVTVKPQGIVSGEAFGVPTVQAGGIQIDLVGLASGEAAGTPAVQTGGVTIQAQGISSEEVAGSPTVQAGAVTIQPQGIGSALTFGVPTIQPGAATVEFAGVETGEAFGSPTVQPGAAVVQPQGIASAETFGDPTVQPGAAVIQAQGIGSRETFGTPTVQPGPATVQFAGVETREAFGTPDLQHLVLLAAILSLESFGQPRIKLVTQVIGQGSVEGPELAAEVRGPKQSSEIYGPDQGQTVIE